MLRLMILISLMLVAVCGASDVNQRIKRRAGEITFLKIDCEANDKFLKDVYCRLKPLNRTLINATVQATILEPQYTLNLRIVQWQKMHSNRYMPGFANTNYDVCEFFASLASDKPNLLKTYLENVIPFYREILKDVMHPCPFQGLTRISYKIQNHIKDIPLIKFLPAADLKTEFIISSGKGEFIWKLTSYLSTK